MNPRHHPPLACLLICLAACGGGGGDAGSPPPPAAPDVTPQVQPPAADLSARSYAATSEADAVMSVDNGQGATLDFWLQTGASGQRVPAQTLLKDASGHAVRSFYDTSGDLTRIVDDASGSGWHFAWTDSGLVASEIDAAGQMQAAYLVRTAADGRLTIARVLGRSGVSGQLTGQVSGAQQAAFALTAQPSALKDMVLDTAEPLPDALQTLLASRAAPAAAGDLLRQALASGDGDSSGVDLVGDAWKNALPEWTQRNRTRLLTGFVLGAACAGLVPGCQAVGIGVSASSLVLLMGGWTAQQGGLRLIDELRNDAGKPRLDDGASTSALDSLRGRAADAWRRGGDLLQEMRDATRTVAAGGTLAAVDDMRTERSSAGTRSPAGYTQPAALPAVGPLPVADTPVTGMLASNSGETFGISGTLGKDGSLTARGNQDDGSASVQLQGSVAGGHLSGSYTDSNGRSGTLDGTDMPLGRCQSRQESGGEGSFSFAYAMGAQGGQMQLGYEMYSIPDRMDVYALDGSGRHAVFSTGGLVSGSGGQTLTLQAQTTLFVAMTAPRSGTAWDFQLSCPQ